MQLVPVLDLMDGVVVHARGGERAAYRPLHGTRAASDPLAVAAGLLARHPFRALYVADLDAIARRGDHCAVLHALRRRFPRIELWVDAGFADLDALAAFGAGDLGRAVLASETLAASAILERAVSVRNDFLLSLDFKGDTFLGPPDLPERPALWPAGVIVMSLARVGRGLGPDLARLARLRAAAPDRRLYAAGGVRDASDLDDLERLGVAGVLLATALHEGRLSRAELARYDSGLY